MSMAVTIALNGAGRSRCWLKVQLIHLQAQLCWEHAHIGGSFAYRRHCYEMQYHNVWA